MVLGPCLDGPSLEHVSVIDAREGRNSPVDSFYRLVELTQLASGVDWHKKHPQGSDSSLRFGSLGAFAKSLVHRVQ